VVWYVGARRRIVGGFGAAWFGAWELVGDRWRGPEPRGLVRGSSPADRWRGSSPADRWRGLEPRGLVRRSSPADRYGVWSRVWRCPGRLPGPTRRGGTIPAFGSASSLPHLQFPQC
jgi:hypothetical protein